MIDRFLKAAARQSMRPMAISHLSDAIAIGITLLYGPGIARAQQNTSSDSQDVPAPAAAPTKKTDGKDKQPVALDAVNVTDVRASLRSALQRISGIQIERNDGEGSTNTKRRTMFGLETRPRDMQINDRMYSLKAMYSF